MSKPDKNKQPDSSDAAKERPNAFLLEETFPSAAGLFLKYAVPKAADTNVMVAFDTNALLLPYNISEADLSELAHVYGKLATEGRLFVPARCAREFIRHRDRKLADMIKVLNDKKSKISVPEAKISPLLEGVTGYKDLADAVTQMNTARKKYSDATGKIIDQIKAWRGDDPVTEVYRKLFVKERLIEHDGAQQEILKEWLTRLRNQVPPGYKDSSKDDTGIGDFLIWKVLLKLGKDRKNDLLFVTGEEKADWFVRSDGEAIYPRPELVDEYRRASGGKCIRLSTLANLLGEMQVSSKVVDEVRVVEASANTAIRVDSTQHRILGRGRLGEVASFDYSANGGIVKIGQRTGQFVLKFDRGSEEGIHLHKTNVVKQIFVLRFATPGSLFLVDSDLDRAPPGPFALRAGESFIVQNLYDHNLAARIIGIENESQGAPADNITLRYRAFAPGEAVVVP